VSQSPIRVLIVDDSAVVRKTMSELLSGDPGIEVMVPAADPFVAAERIRHEVPDVILLDIEMPHMDGLTFLKKLMAQHPIPVVVCSSLAQDGAETTLRALEYGAVEVVAKPGVGTKEFLEESRDRLRAVVHAASRAHVRRPAERMVVAPKLTADAMISAPTGHAMIETTEKVVLIGASTGGTEALSEILQALPADAPAIVVVQHMPEKFTTAFAARLNTLCAVTVKEAADNDSVIRGRVLIAPGNHHLLLKRSGARYFVEVKEGPPVCRHRPSVDVLFRSGARYAGRNAVGIILTGMGDDGARGLLEMKQAGAVTFAQDEKTSIVFGMPNEAIRRGAAGRVLPLQAVAGALLGACQRHVERSL
jgi:two-component system, chemotaxis family, protein-glutamate methylesterase/glutaminase